MRAKGLVVVVIGVFFCAESYYGGAACVALLHDVMFAAKIYNARICMPAAA